MKTLVIGLGNPILKDDGAGIWTARRVRKMLPPGAEVVRPGAQGRQMEGLVASYRLNLSVLSAIALFVGMFLIYQCVTLSVVRRRRVAGGVEVTHGLPEGGLVLQARYRNFEEYRSPEGDVFNSQASDRGFLGRFGHVLGPGDFSIGWQTNLGRDTGRPDSRAPIF